MDSTITFLISSITGVVTFFLGLRRGKAETESVVLSNLEKSVVLYQTIIDDMGVQVSSLRTKIEKLELSIDELLNENKKLKKMLEDANSKPKTK